jgi:hypothetical protein
MIEFGIGCYDEYNKCKNFCIKPVRVLVWKWEIKCGIHRVKILVQNMCIERVLCTELNCTEGRL